MTNDNLKDQLNQLHDVLEKTDQVDSETLELVRELDDEINRLLDPESTDNGFDSVADKAKAVETRFAVEHPVAARFLREIMDTLSKVGI